MLKVSSNQITFNQHESIKSLTLQNQFPKNIIFKVKVSSIGFVNIEPSFGVIRANSSASFIVKALKRQKFDIKVSFNYGLTQSKNYQFNQDWRKVKETSKTQHYIINVSRIQQYHLNEKSNTFINLKPNPTAKIENQFQSVQKFQKRNHSVQIKNLQSNSSNQTNQNSPKAKFLTRINPLNIIQKAQEYSKQLFFQEQPNGDRPFYSSEEMQELIQRQTQLQKMVQNEKIKNEKLNQQLLISEDKLKEVTQDKMQIQIHKSIGIVCEEYHTSFTHIVIIGLICFVFGFLLGKMQAEVV